MSADAVTDRHLPALDGVRGVAILLVLAKHTLPNAIAGGGWLGVDLFFVLSGYLITGILLETRAAPDYYRRFFARRALRIWPLYLLVIGALALLASWAPGFAPTDAADFRRFAPWIWTQAVNLRSGLWGGVPVSPYGVGVYWSLGVEEQFYLAWPLVVACIAPRRLSAICLALAAGSVALRLVASAAGASVAALYVLPVTHLEGLALGGALAAALRDQARRAAVGRQVAGVAQRPLVVGLAGALTLLAAPMLWRGGWTWGADLAGGPLAAALSALTIAAVVTAGPRTPLARALAAPWVVAAGRLSYGLYLLHVPVLFILSHLWPAAPVWAPALVGLPVTAALAWASWKWWEGPWLRLKRRVPRPVPVVAAPSRAGVSHRVRVGEVRDG